MMILPWLCLFNSLNDLIRILTHLKLCFADAIHNPKLAKII